MKMVIVGLLVLVAGLVYRVFDLGVTITYLKESAIESQQHLLALKTYQRAPCSIDRSVDLPSFEKQGATYFAGLRFECRPKDGSAGSVFFYAPRDGS